MHTLILAMVCQVILTLAVMIVMGRRRFAAVRNKQLPYSVFRTMDLSQAEESVLVAGRNYINQFELPVLFFVGVLTCIQLQLTGQTSQLIAWWFVASRVLHSVIHLSSNNVKQRYYSFLMGAFAILALWCHICWQVLQ